MWGGVHGFYYVLEYFLATPVVKLMDLLAFPAWLRRNLARVLTFHLVLLGWVFFRANSISDAALILKKIFFAFSGKLYLGPSQLALYISIRDDYCAPLGDDYAGTWQIAPLSCHLRIDDAAAMVCLSDIALRHCSLW